MMQSDRSRILSIAREFYEDLFKSVRPKQSAERTAQTRPVIMNVGSEELPDITVDLFLPSALDDMKNRKSPGDDGIPIEAIKEGGDILIEKITALFNKCLEEEKIPKSWENAVITLLHKKGHITKLENYRPIGLLSQLYKLFMKIIAKRITKKLDFYQPIEQAFSIGYKRLQKKKKK